MGQPEQAGLLGEQTTMKKIDDLIVYSNRSFYCAFPSVVCLPDGELIAAFRRAPNRKRFGAKLKFHTDPNSYLVLVRSRDNGRTWSPEPELMYAHPMGGSQGPCMTLLSDGSIIASSYAWAPIDKHMTEADFPGFTGLSQSVLLGHGVSPNIGYPWSCLTADGKVLVVYYINMNRDIVGIDRIGDAGLGACHIAATRVDVGNRSYRR